MSQNMRTQFADLTQLGKEQYKELVAAGRFLSILPLPRLFNTERSTVQPVMGSGYFPIIGAVLGLLIWLLGQILGPFIPTIALAALVVVALVILTGGLHLDGLMDTCDGLFSSGTTAARKLEIMRDSHVGSFGVLGGVSAVLLKFAFLASLPPVSLSPLLLVAFLIVSPASRWGMVLAARFFPSANTTGLGAAFRQTVTLRNLLIAGISSFLIALLVGHVAGLLVWAGATIAALLAGAWVMRTLGGLTGDSYGAIIEIAEVVSLLLMVLLPRLWF